MIICLGEYIHTAQKLYDKLKTKIPYLIYYYFLNIENNRSDVPTRCHSSELMSSSGGGMLNENPWEN